MEENFPKQKKREMPMNIQDADRTPEWTRTEIPPIT